MSGVRLVYEWPADRDVSLFQNLPTVSRAASLVGCLWLLPEKAATALLDRALQQGWISLDDLARRIRDRAGHGSAPQLRRLLTGVDAGERSTAERRLTEILRQGGISGWRANEEIREGGRLIGIGDVVFRAARVVVEADGLAHHSSPHQFQRDRTRQNQLVAAGWTVMRFTWHDLHERPAHVLATIRRILAHSAEQT